MHSVCWGQLIILNFHEHETFVNFANRKNCPVWTSCCKTYEDLGLWKDLVHSYTMTKNVFHFWSNSQHRYSVNTGTYTIFSQGLIQSNPLSDKAHVGSALHVLIWAYQKWNIFLFLLTETMSLKLAPHTPHPCHDTFLQMFCTWAPRPGHGN